MKRNRGMSIIFGVGLISLIATSLLGADPTAPVAKSAKKRDTSKAEVLPLVARDGLPINAIYWGSELGQESSVVILLHGKGGSYRDFPVPFVEQLHRAGYAQILVDLRGHGQSKGATLTPEQRRDPTIRRLEAGKLGSSDYDDMVSLDLEAVKQFIYEEHQARYLNMNRIGIVAAEMSTPIAAAFTMVDWQKTPYEDSPDPKFKTPRGQDVHAIVLLSPVTKTGSISIANSMNYLRQPDLGISFLLAFSELDRFDKGATEKIYNLLNPGDKFSDRVGIVKVNQAFRGTELLNKNLGIEQQIISFFDQRLKLSGKEWVDRETRLDKRKKP